MSSVLPKLENELNEEMESLLVKLKNEKTNNVAEKIIDIRDAEKDKFELECVAVVNKYQSMFAVSQRQNIDGGIEIKIRRYFSSGN